MVTSRAQIAPCDRRTATRRDLCSEGDALGGQAINSSSRASWRSSSSAIDVSTSWRRAAIAAAALGLVVLTLGQGRLGDQRTDAGVVRLVGQLRQLLVDDGQLLAADRSRCPTPERRRSTSHFVIAEV